MNTDTERSINSMLKDGYCRQGQTLGIGGWPYMYKHGFGSWHVYNLYDLEFFLLPTNEEPSPMESIRARSDKEAISAFSALYHLEEFSYSIQKVYTRYKIIKKS